MGIRQQRPANKGAVRWTVLLFFIAVISVVSFMYADRQNDISAMVRSWGLGGELLAVLAMGALHMTPVPSEGLLLTYLKVYGVGWGLCYAWLGSTISSAMILLVARRVAHPLLKGTLSDRYEQINAWVVQKGALGLLFARLLPLPAFVVNYVAGCIPAIRAWDYLWTAALSILPYYVGTALIYLGITGHLLMWGTLGSVPLVAVWVIGYVLSRRTKVTRRCRVGSGTL